MASDRSNGEDKSAEFIVLIMPPFIRCPVWLCWGRSGLTRVARLFSVVWLRWLIACSVCIGFASPARFQLTAQSVNSPGACQTTVAKDLSLDCLYGAGTTSRDGSPHLWLKHASISFEVKGESYMSVSLQIKNEDTERFAERRTVFIEIDDTKGVNYLRRALRHADLGLLEPGETRVFFERLLVGAFRPGEYIISLWIPSPEPGETYNSRRNFLLRGENVADPDTGLNKLAQFTVLPSSKR
jgi:hypothetical protein